MSYIIISSNVIRRFLVLLFVVIMVFNIFYMSVYSSPVAIALGAKEIIAISALLIGGGLVYSSREDIHKSAVDFYFNYMDSPIRDAFHSTLDSMVDGVANFGVDVWNNVRNYISGSTGVLEGYNVYSDFDIVASLSGGNYSSFNFVGYTFSTVKLGTFSNHQEWGLAMDGEVVSSRLIAEVPDPGGSPNETYRIYKENTYPVDSPLGAPSPYFYIILRTDGDLDIYWRYIDTDGVEKSMRVFKCRRYKNGSNTGSVYYSALVDIPIVGSQSYSYSSVATGSGWQQWEQKVEDKQRVEIPLPPDLTIDDLVEKNFRNVEEKNYSDTLDPSVPGDNTDTGGGTIDYDVPTDITLDFSPLMAFGDTLTGKFPFCIPWDIKRSIESLVASPKAPRWTIEFDTDYFVGGGSFTIDFAEFEELAKIVRWAIMIIFSMGLMIKTRDIIKG